MCVVCSRPDRMTIESMLVSMTTGVSNASLEDIAAKLNVDIEELKMHALFHTPLVSSEDLGANGEGHTSLVRSMKLKEADMLAEVEAEYLVTLKAMGRCINALLADNIENAVDFNKQFTVAKMLTKPVVELYLGLGSEIRQTVKTAAEVDRMLNGPKDGATAGLQALAEAIRGSESSSD